MEELRPLDSQSTTAPIELPPNNSGGDISGAIDSATTGQFNAISDLDLLNRQLDPLGNQSVALNNATDSLFRGGGSPNAVNLGQSSGGLVGSSPIIVEGGGGVPFALLERQRAANQQNQIQQAKDLRIASGKALPTLDKSNDASINRGLLNAFNSSLRKFQEQALVASGGNLQKANAILKSQDTNIGRGFINSVSNLNQFAAEGSEIIDEVASIQADIASGKVVSGAALRFVDDVNSVISSIDGVTTDDITNLSKSRQRFNAFQSIDSILNNTGILNSLKATITETDTIRAGGGNQTIIDKERTENFDKGIKSAVKTLMLNTSIKQQVTEEELEGIIRDRVGSTTKNTITVKNKPVQPKGSGGFTEDSTDINKRQFEIDAGADAFVNADGTIRDEPTADAIVLAGKIVGNKAPSGNEITKVRILKGEPRIIKQEVNGKMVDVENEEINTKDRFELTVPQRVNTFNGAKFDSEAKEYIDLTSPKARSIFASILNTGKGGNKKVATDNLRLIKKDRPTEKVNKSESLGSDEAIAKDSNGNRFVVNIKTGKTIRKL